MKEALKYSLYLIILSILLISGCHLLNYSFDIGLTLSDIAGLTLAFCATAIVTQVIFFRGQSINSAGQAFYTLLAISIKFLSELIVALIWFLIAKKTSISSVLLFFVLYLSFTLFSVIVILKTLKNKSL